MPTIQDRIYVAVIHDYDPSHPPRFSYWVPGMYDNFPPGQIILVCKEKKNPNQYWIPSTFGSKDVPFPPYVLNKDCLTIIGEL